MRNEVLRGTWLSKALLCLVLCACNGKAADVPANAAGMSVGGTANGGTGGTASGCNWATSPGESVMNDCVTDVILTDSGSCWGYGVTYPRPEGSECDCGGERFSLDIEQRRLTWSRCQTQPDEPWSFVAEPLLTLTDAQVELAKQAVREITVHAGEDGCGEDKPGYSIDLVSSDSEQTYLDSFYACLERPGAVYVDNIDPAFELFREITRDSGAADPVLCDGTDEVRFVVNVDGGFVDQAYAFYGAYGHTMLAIDGHCDYWVVGHAGGEVRQGHIDDARASQLESELSFGHLGEFDVPLQLCPDGAPMILQDPSGSTQCGCVCDDPSQPAAWKSTIVNARNVVNELYAAGQPTMEGLSILLQRSEPSMFEGLVWPLEQLPEMLEPDYDIQADSGIRVESPEERSALRAIRAQWFERESYANLVPMMHDLGADAGGPVYFNLYLRDEVPPKVVAALHDARQAPPVQ